MLSTEVSCYAREPLLVLMGGEWLELGSLVSSLSQLSTLAEGIYLALFRVGTIQ